MERGARQPTGLLAHLGATLCLLLLIVLGPASAARAGEESTGWLSPDGAVHVGADGKARYLFQPEFRPAPWLAQQLAERGLEGLEVAQVTPEVAVPAPPRARTPPAPIPGRLLLTGTVERVAEARALLARLDTAPRSVYVSILMTEVRCWDRTSMGGSMFFDKGAGPNPENTVFRGGATTFEPDEYLRSALTGAAPFEGTSLRFGDMDVDGGAFEYTLRMLALRGDAEFLAWPCLMVNEGSSGEMASLEDVPQFLIEFTQVPGDIVPNARTIVEQTGLKLKVTPVSIGRESAILDLDLWMRIPEDVSDGTATPGNLRLRTREVRSRLTVRDREPLMLGGIVLRNRDTRRRGLPRPRELELLDPLHSARMRGSGSTEIVFLVRARIVPPSRTGAQSDR